ncbi:hypothetical protein K2173_016781 [Erythroxylum novogranatense]|uniref:dolichol kinase n=1 Tax=Erythroxylum novogranatense TaxID=1862640 RepID=A0AAV8SHR1_9ROSI|nr:hypothetical protein K2173_016781 [Erythroxylum novogranatense]
MAVSISPLLNGERAVVTLFVGCILFSLPYSLLLHGLSLSLLSLFAFSVEILSDNSPSLSLFKTRAGASSGILLGAVTLPALMLAKLIQMSRALLLHQTNHQELNYLALEYWASSAASFFVLVFLCISVRCSPKHSLRPPFSAWLFKFGSSCCVLYAALSFLSLNGLLSNFPWVISHGCASVILLQHLLNTFPSCASIGEALLVTASLVLYFGDMMACTFEKFRGYLTPSVLVPVRMGTKRSEISIIIQGLLLGLLILPVAFKSVLHIMRYPVNPSNCGARAYSEGRQSVVFFALLGFITIVVSPSWMQLVEDFDVHPYLWVVKFVFSEPVKRLSLCIYWVCVILASVQRFYNISKNSKIERILLRKYYHLVAVLMFSPAVIFQPKFLGLAFGAALAAFLILEIIRVWKIWPFGQVIHQFMNAFTDHRDSDLLIVSHFSLLLGCAIPIWMSSGYNDRPLAPFSGILSLGIGDTMASMVGHKYGVLRWSKTGKKTIEGTAAGITSVLAACSVLLPLLASTGYILTQNWVSLLLAVIVSGLLEAYTAQLDNAFIPLVFYSLLCL